MGFHFQNNLENLDPSYKTDLDSEDCFGRKCYETDLDFTECLRRDPAYIQEIRYLIA